MFLKSLTISNSGTLVRQVTFRKGLNLIVDETTGDRRESGNNVGKTTILRLIDYCFGGDGKNIYSDPEFKDKSNTEVARFLTENNIIITMTLVDDLESPHSRQIVVRRNFLKRNEKIFEIDGEQQTIESFPRELKRLIFDSTSDKPRLRQIIAKNIRDEKDRVAHTLRVLNPYTRAEEYEALYLFWMGIEVDTNARKQQLIQNRATERRMLDALKKETSLSQIEQSLIVVNRTIDELDRKKDAFEIHDGYEHDLGEMNGVKQRINELSTRIGSLSLRRDLVLESKAELEDELSNVDPQNVRALYEEAKLLLPDLQKSFEATVGFHNQMVREKVEFITRELPSLDEELAEARRAISDALAKEKALGAKLRRLGIVEDLQLLITELNQAYEQRGRLEEQKRRWDASTERIREIDAQLEAINKGIESKDELLQGRVAEFNRYFSDISWRLYGEKFVLSADWDTRGLDLKVSSIGGNLGTGKKKGQIAAFDLAYIRFADAEDIRCLHFVLQDQIENIHDNQISSLLTEIVSEIDCQYILPVLRDKLPAEVDVDAYQVVSLSQDDKLFRL